MVSVRYIARELGLSSSTVSQALNDKGMLAPETRERVRAIARQLGYYVPSDPFGVDPALSGRPLRVVLVGDGKDPSHLMTPLGFTALALEGLQKAAEPYHLTLILSPQKDLCNPPPSLVGTILVGGYLHPDYVNLIEQQKEPVVMVGSHTTSGTVCSVEPDGVLGIQLAVEHLVKLGHRQIALINGPDNTATSSAKLTGFLRAAYDFGLRTDLIAVAEEPFYLDASEKLAYRLLSGPWRDVTAIVCAYETLAAGVVNAAQFLGLDVPNDVSVVGYHDDGSGRMCKPPLTTVGIPSERLGRMAISLILSARANSDLLGTRMVVTPVLVERATTTTPARKA